jgi:hypothetical protein
MSSLSKRNLFSPFRKNVHFNNDNNHHYSATINQISTKLLTSRFLLYLLLVVGLVDVLFLAAHEEYVFVAVFFLFGFITSYFSPNMIVVLFVAIVGCNIVRSGKGAREGMETGQNEDITGDDISLPSQEEDLQTNDDLQKQPTPATISPAVALSDVVNEDGDAESLEFQTKKLIETQKQLMKNMEILEPMFANMRNLGGNLGSP